MTQDHQRERTPEICAPLKEGIEVGDEIRASVHVGSLLSSRVDKHRGAAELQEFGIALAHVDEVYDHLIARGWALTQTRWRRDWRSLGNRLEWLRRVWAGECRPRSDSLLP